jgi:hypothetical protein
MNNAVIDLWSYWCMGWLYWWLPPPPRAKVIFIAEWRARQLASPKWNER